MLEFRPLTFEDKARIDRIVFSAGSLSSGYNFGNMYSWNHLFRHLIAFSGDRMTTMLLLDGQTCFSFPIGSGDLRAAIPELTDFAREKGFPLCLCGVEEENCLLLEKLFPGRFKFEEDRPRADYIYKAESLASYSGKALHSKKNHCNRFEREHPHWNFVPISAELVPLCLDMLERWQAENLDRLDESIAFEREAIYRAFSSYDKLGLEGGVLLDGSRALGFSAGELCCSDCFDVHFEKADIGVPGAYSVICRETAKLALRNHPELKYINREEDMGLEGLRKSKLSYKPEFMLKKYTVRCSDG